jgi:hypothetical protein
MKIKSILISVLLLIEVKGYTQKRVNEKREVEEFTNAVYSITEVMFHDVINPPAAARFYAYSTLAAYQVTSSYNPLLKSLAPVLKDFPIIKNDIGRQNINIYFSAEYAMLETAKNLIPSGYSLEEKQNELYKKYLSIGVKKQLLDSSVTYAVTVSKLIVKYALSDGYLKLSTMQRYQPKESDSTWYPTPPEYMSAVEPNWKTIRPFFLDSANQFKPATPTPFSSKMGSPFENLMHEVYTTGNNLTDDQRLIARYWDCNPFANFYSGHVSVGIKKISPGGHWMSITGIACKKGNVSFLKTVQTYTLVAMGLHDGFISCWSEKYKSDRVRPKTVINRFIDDKWNPLIETPPFPEYTSGHSVISTISAAILTKLLGEEFAFTDNTEVLFGFDERHFKSFRAAAEEAAISRLYGGIHFRDAIVNGQRQGEKIGEFLLTKAVDSDYSVSIDNLKK